ncbi:MAG: hypothetical protein KA069_02305 [Candidatus Saccharimonas sp.]|jgi:hypothetical protein|nr:hypothetical protein [Candidatus Saccharimonas sp.]
MTQNPASFFLLVSVLIVAIILVVYLTMSRRGVPSLNSQKYQTKWLEIENSLSRENPQSYPMAILNADKLLDLALKERHIKGETMGERMKSAQNIWTNANHVWGAHKIRNQLAHETDVHVTPDIALRSLSAYKQALKDLGAI